MYTFLCFYSNNWKKKDILLLFGTQDVDDDGADIKNRNALNPFSRIEDDKLIEMKILGK